MIYIRKLVPAVILSFIFGTVIAQQVPMYSQYIINGFLINPSFAGRDGYTTANLTVREQWIGMNGAPSTYAASFQTRLLKTSYIAKTPLLKRKFTRPTRGSRIGLGGYVFNVNNGIMRRTGIQLAYAYHIPLGQYGGYPNDFSLGLALTTYQYAVKTGDLVNSYSDDPYLSTYDRSVIIPDFNFGASFTTTKYYVGFAMTNLLRGSLLFDNTSEHKRVELGHYFLTGGIKFPLLRNWIIEPSAFIKSSDMLFNAIQVDLTTRVYYKNDYWMGLSWRTNDAIILMTGLKYDRFYFAYAIDFTLTDIRNQSYGTHELTVALRFGESARRYRWVNSF